MTLVNNQEKSQYDSSAIAAKKENDADYKPILRGIINTRCNYDGSKIDDIMEG
jgi:hypothetical protein